MGSSLCQVGLDDRGGGGDGDDDNDFDNVGDSEDGTDYNYSLPARWE